MNPTDPDERRKVRVRYVARGYGLALTIDEENDSGVDEQPTHVDESTETNDGYLTVISSGVTTLELPRPDGLTSVLVWDESEVAWDSLAG